MGDLSTIVELNAGSEGEFAAFGFPEAGLFPLGLRFTEQGAVQRGFWGLTAWAAPVSLGRHRLDQLFAAHRRAGLAQDLGRSVESAELSTFLKSKETLA